MTVKKILIRLFACLLVAFGLVYGWRTYKRHTEPPPVVTDVKNTAEVAKRLHVTPKTAEKITTAIERGKVEHVKHYTAPSVEAVQKAEKGTADRVLIHKLPTPPGEGVAVDVYRLNLSKAHKIKSGVTVEGGKVFPAIGYQAGRFEGVVTLDGSRVKNATALYTVVEW